MWWTSVEEWHEGSKKMKAIMLLMLFKEEEGEKIKL
jgi:hypothetical protein